MEDARGDKLPDLLDDPFCIYPFTTLNVMPSGQAKPCCAFSKPIESNGRPMSVYEHSVEEIWSSEFLRDIRRKLASGKPVKECGYCYRQEKAGTVSMGTAHTRRWETDNPEFQRDQWSADDFSISEGPAHLDLDVGNLCNLKCRMCNSSFSSGIANDPVHSRWAPPGPVPARWHGDSSLIAPGVVLGVVYDQIGHPKNENGVLRSWISGHAGIRASITGVGVSGFKIGLFAPSETSITLRVNGEVLLEENFSGKLERRFDIAELRTADTLDLEFSSSASVAIEEVRLLRSARGNSHVLFSRISGGEQWFQSDDFINGELLKNPERLRQMRLIGGEPFLIKEVRSLLRNLIDLGVAANITLFISTNGTQFDDDWLFLLTHFKRVYLVFSLDGLGSVSEYIRFPSKWGVIDRNIKTVSNHDNISVSVNMTVQAYNVLHVIDLVRYCEDREIEFRYHLLQHPPYLSVKAVPDVVRKLAVARLRSFEAKRAFSRVWDLKDLASAIENQEFDSALNAQFFKFTEELDTSRDQDAATALPELWNMMKPPEKRGAGGIFSRLIAATR